MLDEWMMSAYDDYRLMAKLYIKSVTAEPLIC